MNQARTYALLLLLVVSVAVGASVWLANGEGPTVNPPVSGANECAGGVSSDPLRAMSPNANQPGGAPANERDARGEPGSDGNPSNTSPADRPGNGPSPHSPDGPGERDWKPEDFANNRLVWGYPKRLPNAAVQAPVDEYDGQPAFIVGGLSNFRYDWPFDRFNPDGMLIVKVQFFQVGKAKPLIEDSTFAVTSADGSTVYSFSPVPRGGFLLGVPYSYKQSETLEFRMEGPKMLPIEGVISQYGSLYRRGNETMRGMITGDGLVYVNLRPFPADYNDFRKIIVQDKDRRPIETATLTWDGVQILGRSNADGWLRFPWPHEYAGVRNQKQIREDFFFITAPGYVPVLLERGEFEGGRSPGAVTLRARELLVSCYHHVTNRDALVLRYYARGILNHRIDLIPIPDGWQEVENWNDARTVLCGGSRWYEREFKEGTLPTFVGIHTRPFLWGETYHDFNTFGTQRLSDVLDYEPTENWRQYGHWYFGRWDYDESEGRFDVALPYAGRFLLLVGEYNRAAPSEKIDGQYANGQVTHALYIDARNPADLQSKLLVHPLG